VRRAGRPEKVDHETVFEAASMSKPLYAYGVACLVDRGELDLDRPLDSFLPVPYLPAEPLAAKITARHVFLHRTGLPNWRDGGWKKGGPMPVRFEPGTRFGYSGEGFLYLQTAVEKLTKTPTAEWTDKRLLTPLGLKRSSYVWRPAFETNFAGGHDAEGAFKEGRRFFDRANAAYSLFTTPTDYARFLIAIMDPDRTAPHSPSATMVAAMTTVQVDPLPDGSRTRRSLGWAVASREDGGWVHHSGSNGTGFRCTSRFHMTRGAGCVIMTNAASGRPVWEAILAVIDEEDPSPREPQAQKEEGPSPREP